MLNDFRTVSLSLLLLLTSLGCIHGDEIVGTPCDWTCICDGRPGRPGDPCSSCNPSGEVIYDVACPANVAVFGECGFVLSSDDPSALELEETEFTVRVPGGKIAAPTTARLPERPVFINLRRTNDGATTSDIYQVRDTCQ